MLRSQAAQESAEVNSRSNSKTGDGSNKKTLSGWVFFWVYAVSNQRFGSENQFVLQILRLSVARWCPRQCKMHKCSSPPVNSPRPHCGCWYWPDLFLAERTAETCLRSNFLFDFLISQICSFFLFNMISAAAKQELLNQLFNDEEIATTVASWTAKTCAAPIWSFRVFWGLQRRTLRLLTSIQHEIGALFVHILQQDQAESVTTKPVTSGWVQTEVVDEVNRLADKLVAYLCESQTIQVGLGLSSPRKNGPPGKRWAAEPFNRRWFSN